MCADCPLIDACRAAATSSDYGVWAGLTRTERHNPSKTARCGTESGYKRHKRLGDPYCDPCWDAMRAVSRRARAKAKRAKGVAA